MLRVIKIGFPLLLVLLAGGAFFWYHQPHQGVGDISAAYQLSADSLYRAFAADEARSNKIYLGQVLRVTGKVSAKNINGGEILVQLETADPVSGVSCRMAKDKLPELSGWERGGFISIKGRCTGFLMDVNLVDCEIVQ